jgi:glyoxylase-like metal-dependent hydrolase (beta-lactamase superfamily II)
MKPVIQAPARRRWLAAAATTAASVFTGGAHAQAAAPQQRPEEVENGVWMLRGLRGEPVADTLGRIGNSGFIVGRTGVLLVDSGTSYLHGQALLAAVQEVTDKPVKAALLTQARQEFIFGGAALQAQGIPLLMHRDAAALMAQRCEGCLKTLKRELGEDAMRGTVVPKPDRVFDETWVFEDIGRPVLISHHGLANGPGSTSALETRSGTLFSGGLVENRRVPDVQDGDIATWRSALGALRTLRIETIVPAHGKAGAPRLVQATDAYLADLQRRCAELLKAGTALSAVADAADLPAYRDWDEYENIHRRNASIEYLRLEREQLRAAAQPGR